MSYDKKKQNKIIKRKEESQRKKELEEKEIIEQIEKCPKVNKIQIQKIVDRMYDDAMRRKLGTQKMKLKRELINENEITNFNFENEESDFGSRKTKTKKGVNKESVVKTEHSDSFNITKVNKCSKYK